MDSYIGDIIAGQRFDTRNGDTSAISNSVIVRYNNYAQNRLYGRITNGFAWLFEETITASIVADQAEYDVNDNLAFGTRITNVEYRQDSTAKWYPLAYSEDRYRNPGHSGRPRKWWRRHGTVLIHPVPSTAQGQLRITYERALDKLALRVAQVNGTPSGTDIAVDNEDSDLTANLAANAYVCISDAFGAPMLYNGIVSSFSSPTLTLTANVSDYLQTGYSLSDLDNGYITVGKYSTTHSKLPNEAEGYFNEWVSRKLNNIDSSEQEIASDSGLIEIENTIVASLKIPDKARKTFPVVDHEMLLLEFD